jgi:hypothetical protein
VLAAGRRGTGQSPAPPSAGPRPPPADRGCRRRPTRPREVGVAVPPIPVASALVGLPWRRPAASPVQRLVPPRGWCHPPAGGQARPVLAAPAHPARTGVMTVFDVAPGRVSWSARWPGTPRRCGCGPPLSGRPEPPSTPRSPWSPTASCADRQPSRRPGSRRRARRTLVQVGQSNRQRVPADLLVWVGSWVGSRRRPRSRARPAATAATARPGTTPGLHGPRCGSPAADRRRGPPQRPAGPGATTRTAATLSERVSSTSPRWVGRTEVGIWRPGMVLPAPLFSSLRRLAIACTCRPSVGDPAP